MSLFIRSFIPYLSSAFCVLGPVVEIMTGHFLSPEEAQGGLGQSFSSCTHQHFWILHPLFFPLFPQGKCRFSLFIFPVLRPFGFNGCWGTSYLLIIPYLSWVFSTNLIPYIPQIELFFSVAVILKLDSLLKSLPALSLNDPAWPHKENKGCQLWNISIFLTIHPHLIHIFLVFFKKGTMVRSSKTKHNLHN